jgi:hypothetical protein
MPSRALLDAIGNTPLVELRLGPEATVATIIIDSGLRYLSTDVFRA